MIYAVLFALVFTGAVFMITVYNAVSAPMLKNGAAPSAFPAVSVLVPARNEAETIGGCVGSLLAQDYPGLEIIVLDDGSQDNTAAIVDELSVTDRRVRLITGKALPPGWTGKNWACSQLAKHAGGGILIFTDADNRHEPDAVLKTVWWMEKLHLDLFSAFPQQITHTLAEKLVVPSVYMTVYSYLPLRLTYLLPFPSLAAANGQWLAFTRKAYTELNAHEAAKAQVVEDTWIARFAKKQGKKILTAAGTGAVYSRMYTGWRQVWNGFSKNLFGLMGYNAPAFILLLLVMLAAYVLPYACLFYRGLLLPALACVALNIAVRLVLSMKYRDPLITAVLHPAAVLATVATGIHSMYAHFRGTVTWKGRKVSV